MAHWLLKTEPGDYSFQRLIADRRTVWSGVTNAQARIHLRNMKRGDLAFIYHTGDEKAVVGIAAIAADPYADPAGGDDRAVVIDVTPKQALPRPVTLAAIKADARFQDLDLVRNSRLSVMPVPRPLWDALLDLAAKA